MGMEVTAQPGGASAGTDFCNRFSFLYEYPKLQAGWMGIISQVNFHVIAQHARPQAQTLCSTTKPREANISVSLLTSPIAALKNQKCWWIEHFSPHCFGLCLYHLLVGIKYIAKILPSTGLWSKASIKAEEP